MREMVSEVTVRAERRAVSSVPGLLRRCAQRGWRPGQFQVLPGVGNLCAFYFQDGDVAVQVIADICVGAVGRKGDALGKPAELDLGSDPGDLLAVDLECHGGAGLVVVE